MCAAMSPKERKTKNNRSQILYLLKDLLNTGFVLLHSTFQKKISKIIIEPVEKEWPKGTFFPLGVSKDGK